MAEKYYPIPLTLMPEFVSEVAKRGLLTPERVMSIAAEADDMELRGLLYARLLAYDVLDDDRKPIVYKEALNAAIELTTSGSHMRGQRPYSRGRVMHALAPHLPESDFTEAMTLILEIGDNKAREMALETFAPCLDEKWLRQLFRAVMSYPDDKSWQKPRDSRLISIVPYMKSPEQTRIFEHALQIKEQPDDFSNIRAQLLIALAQHTDAFLRQRIYENRYFVTRHAHEHTLTLLTGLMQNAEDSEKDRYVTDLMDGLLNTDYGDKAAWQPAEYVRKFGYGFAPHLTKMQLAAIVHMLIGLPESRSRCYALGVLLEFLDVGQQRLAVEEGLSMIPQLHGQYDFDADDEVRAHALTFFAPFVSDNLRVRYLRIARSLESRERSHPLRELAIHTGDETERNVLLAEAWDAAVNLPFASGISHSMSDQTELLRLIPHLNEALRQKTLEYALTNPILVNDIGDIIAAVPDRAKQYARMYQGMRAQIIETLVPTLSAVQLEATLKAMET